jgi:undecaprenol kinase/diacylglycerol kinase (ATP)
MRLIKSFGFAFNGLRQCWNEPNFKIHLLVSVLAIVLATWLRISAQEWLLVILCIAVVLSLEMLNTAIEHLCNLVHPEQHPVIKLVKDISAAAVLLVAIMSVCCGTIIFLPKLLIIFQNL